MTWHTNVASISCLLIVAVRLQADEAKLAPIWNESGFSASHLTFSQDGKVLVAVGFVKDGVGTRVWDTSTGKEIARVKVADAGPVAFPAISADGSAISLVEADGTAVRVRDAKTGETKVGLSARMTRVWTMGFDPSGKKLAVVDRRLSPMEVRLFDLETGQEQPGLKARTYSGSPVFSPDGKLLAIGKGVWDLATGKQIIELNRILGNAIGNDLTFDPTAKLVAAAGPSDERESATDVVGIWDLNAGKKVGTLDVQLDRIEALAYSPDGKTLAIAGRGKANIVQLWGTGTRERLAVLDSGGFRNSQDAKGTVQALAFSPDGKLLATAGPQSVALWNVGMLVPDKGPRGK